MLWTRKDGRWPNPSLATLKDENLKRLAMIAQTGFARAIYPVHAPLDGDVLFAAATGEKKIDPLAGLTELGMVAELRGLPRGLGRELLPKSASGVSPKR